MGVLSNGKGWQYRRYAVRVEIARAFRQRRIRVMPNIVESSAIAIAGGVAAPVMAGTLGIG